MVSNVIEWASVCEGTTMHTITLYAASPEEFQAFTKELSEKSGQ